MDGSCPFPFLFVFVLGRRQKSKSCSLLLPLLFHPSTVLSLSLSLSLGAYMFKRSEKGIATIPRARPVSEPLICSFWSSALSCCCALCCYVSFARMPSREEEDEETGEGGSRHMEAPTTATTTAFKHFIPWALSTWLRSERWKLEREESELWKSGGRGLAFFSFFGRRVVFHFLFSITECKYLKKKKENQTGSVFLRDTYT